MRCRVIPISSENAAKAMAVQLQCDGIGGHREPVNSGQWSVVSGQWSVEPPATGFQACDSCAWAQESTRRPKRTSRTATPVQIQKRKNAPRKAHCMARAWLIVFGVDQFVPLIDRRVGEVLFPCHRARERSTHARFRCPSRSKTTVRLAASICSCTVSNSRAKESVAPSVT